MPRKTSKMTFISTHVNLKILCSKKIKMSKPIDNDTRKLAVSEQDKNIVVTDGAGTGKTTLLVNRMLHLLLGHKRIQTEESPILRIVAMTFTEKAASEMKIRLMQELEKIVSFINGHASQEDERKLEELLSDIRDLYHTTHGEIERRQKKSLEDIDQGSYWHYPQLCGLYPASLPH